MPVFEVKNLEYPAYDPRGSVGMALAYATSDRGGCHMRSWPIAVEALSEDPDADPFGTAGKAAFVCGEQDENAAEWSLVGCDFIVLQERRCHGHARRGGHRDDGRRVSRPGPAGLESRAPLQPARGLDGGGRLHAAEGFEIPLKDSGRSLDPALFAEMKREYYEVRGWDTEGRPTAELVRELGLGGYA